MARRERYLFGGGPSRGKSILTAFAVVALMLLAGLVAANLGISNTVIYTREYITLSSLPKELESWTILHMTDLNGENLGKRQSAVHNAIGKRSWSCVVLGGDMVGSSGEIQPVLDLIEPVSDGTPILLLPGDNDPALYDPDGLELYAPWVRQLQEAGVTLLDEPVSFTRDGKTIWFIPAMCYGLNLNSAEKAWQNQVDTIMAQVEALTGEQEAALRRAKLQLERVQRIREKTESIRASDVQICVTHHPLTKEDITQARLNDGAKVFSLGKVNVVLAGGLCAGQWRIPGVGAVYVPEKGFFPSDEGVVGMNYLTGVWQHISPGLGASSAYPWMPFRLFNSPGATTIVLTRDLH